MRFRTLLVYYFHHKPLLYHKCLLYSFLAFLMYPDSLCICSIHLRVYLVRFIHMDYIKQMELLSFHDQVSHIFIILSCYQHYIQLYRLMLMIIF